MAKSSWNPESRVQTLTTAGFLGVIKEPHDNDSGAVLIPDDTECHTLQELVP